MFTVKVPIKEPYVLFLEEAKKAINSIWSNIASILTRLDILEEPRWDDLKFPATGLNLDSAATRYSVDTTELGTSFHSDARYTNEQLGMVVQLPHAWKEGTILKPHIHWIQNQAAVPNWLMAYRVYNNGEVPGAFSFSMIDNTVFTYTSGSICQISGFPDIDMYGLTISSIIDIKLWRDTANTSTLFAGADPVATDALLKEYDIHYQLDSNGSVQEYVK